jgi:L-fucose mutarotase
MGHGDALGLVDRNFPAYATGRPVVTLPHSRVGDVLAALLQVFPIDTFPASPVVHMLTDEGQDGPGLGVCRPIWDQAEGRQVDVRGVRRHGEQGFYALARQAFVVVQTGETLPYACYLIPKGVIGAPAD